MGGTGSGVVAVATITTSSGRFSILRGKYFFSVCGLLLICVFLDGASLAVCYRYVSTGP
jgi:hypothetical protein